MIDAYVECSFKSYWQISKLLKMAAQLEDLYSCVEKCTSQVHSVVVRSLPQQQHQKYIVYISTLQKQLPQKSVVYKEGMLRAHEYFWWS